MSNRYPAAVVLGASISGLLAARALSGHFDRVVVVDRDVLPDGAAMRAGVPQSAHGHGLLASGYRVMHQYFPGMMEDLNALGAPLSDVVGDFLWFQYGHWKLRFHSGLRGITVSRPCLEAAIRERVNALPNVTLLERTEAMEPIFAERTGCVTGVTLRRGERNREEQFAADLVVDATGKGSRSSRWLERWGFGEPETVLVKVNVGYATRTFDRRPGDFFNSSGAVVSGTPPQDTRYAAVLAAEGDRWVITLVGTMGDYPPTDEQQWMKFAESLPVPAVHDLASTARPLSQITSYRFPAYQRRLYERMRRFPTGFLAIGDALCHFNPIYGQGMSVAALEAAALEESLPGNLDELASRFYRRAKRIIDSAWFIATCEDLRFPQVEGVRPPGFSIMNRYLERVHAAAAEDPGVCRKFFDVLNLFAPPTSLLSPRIVCRVLARRTPQGTGSPGRAMRPRVGVPA